MKNGYKINFIMEEITITKKFADAASMLGTYEYETLIQLMRDLPSFRIKMYTKYHSNARRIYEAA